LVTANGGFENFDRIAGWVLEEDVPDSNSAWPVIAELDTCAMQGLDCRVEVGDLDQDAVPSPARGQPAIR
jgi:hypothetical protein